MASLPKNAGPKSRPEKQLELLFVLKVQLDLIYKQLNHFEGTCKSVDRLNRKIRNSKLNPDQMFAEFVKFERNYRVLRKKLCKLDKILLTGNPYDKLYDLYESLVIGESIETGENLIDTSAIDSPVVDEVSCSGSVENEDTPVDDLSDSDDCNETQFDPKQLETSNPATSIVDSSSVLVADGSKSAPVSNLEFQCDECDKSFNRSYKLRFHKRTHPSESPYRCNFEGCTYGTDRSHLLAKHQTVHTCERPFQCDHCDKCFKLLCHLNVHKIIHESKPRFVCRAEGCDFKSRHPISFKNHSRRVHANDRPFQCSWFECYYKTHLYTSLKCHQKGHLKKFSIHLKANQSVKTELHEELCDLYANLINEYSTAVDEVGSSRSVEIEDTPMDDLSGSEDTPTDDLAGIEDIPVDDLAEIEDIPVDDLGGIDDTPVDDLAGIGDTPVDDLSGIDDTPVDDLAGIEDTPVDDHAGIEDTPVDDLSGIEDTPVDDLSDSDDCIEILYDSKQLETSNLGTSILDSSPVLVAEVGEQSSAPVNSQKFKCHQCDFTTDRFSFLTNHRMSVHLDDRPFRCPICAKSFKHSSNLSGHKRIHQREPRYKCNWEGCSYSCHYTDDLKTHEISDHNGKAPFQCDQCDKSYRLESHLLLHKKGHPIPKLRYRCRYEGCDFRSHQRDTLQLHQINVHRSDQLLKHSFGLSRHHKTAQIQANLDNLKKSSDSIS